MTREDIINTRSKKIADIKADKDGKLRQNSSVRKSLIAQIGQMAKDAGLSYNATCPLCDMDTSAETGKLPDGIHIGNLNSPLTGGDWGIPAILPFTESNVTGFCKDLTCAEQMNNMIQRIALRFILSLPSRLTKIHIVDLKSRNQYLTEFNTLPTIIKKGAVIGDKKQLEEFMTELERLVENRNANERVIAVNAGGQSVRDYNELDTTKEKIPYHFCFFLNINDSGIDDNILGRLYGLCDNRNASNCGIYVFYTVDKESVEKSSAYTQNGIKKLMGISTMVDKGANGFHFSNSVYGPDFDEKHTFNIEELPSNKYEWYAKEIAKRLSTHVTIRSELSLMCQNGMHWKGDTTKGITIPIGDKGEDRVNLTFGNNSNDYFALIAGKPGFGKSVLLNEIICNGALLYSPQELEFYIIDCARTGFKPYEDLPHVRFLSMTKQREFADSAIDFLDKEMSRRAKLYKKAADEMNEVIDKIERYREVTGKVLPRIVVIIDEFQVILHERDSESGKIARNLEGIIKEARKFGIHLILCTQDYSSINTPFDIDNITLRIAFQLEKKACAKILGYENDAATHLTKKGECVLNNRADRDKTGNIIFQGAFTDENQRKIIVDFCKSELAKLDVEIPKRYIFDDENPGDLDSNLDFIRSYTTMRNDVSDEMPIYVGKPLFIRDKHEYFTFKNDVASNLLISGDDIKSALFTIAFTNYQYKKYFPQDTSSLYIVDLFTTMSKESSYLSNVSKEIGANYIVKQNLSQEIGNLCEELNRRIEADKKGEKIDIIPIIISITNIGQEPSLRKNGFKLSPISTQIATILKDGPSYRMHIIVYSTDELEVDNILGGTFSLFGNRIFLRNGVKKSINPLARRTGEIDCGKAFFENKDRTTTYPYDPILIYQKYSSEAIKDETIKYMFSIYERNETS